MPGQRIFTIVAMRFTPDNSVPTPATCSDHYIVIDPGIWTVRVIRERRISEPARPRELADEQRRHDQHRARDRHPEAEVIEKWEGDVTRADLERNNEVHQTRDQRHRDEEDHDHAMRREDLIEVTRGQIPFVAVEGDGLLRAHHDRVGKAAQKHDDAENDIHGADALVIDAREPLVPEIAPQLEVGNGTENRRRPNHNADKRDHQDRLVEGQRFER